MSEPNSEINRGSITEESTDSEKETAKNCNIMKEIKNTKLTCSGTSEEKCKECERQEPALKGMHDKADNGEVLQKETSPDTDEEAEVLEENAKHPKECAKEKLEFELMNAKDKTFADPIIKYLINRCEDDIGLCEDVCQQHKAWKKCFDYICLQAKKQANGNSQCAVSNDTVFEWAEDYYHLDDKEIERKKKQDEAAKKAKEKSTISKKETVPAKPMKNQSSAVPVNKPEKKSIKPKDQLEGQFSIFDLM